MQNQCKTEIITFDMLSYETTYFMCDTKNFGLFDVPEQILGKYSTSFVQFIDIKK